MNSTDPNCWEEPLGEAEGFAHDLMIQAEGQCPYCGGQKELTL